MTIKRIIVIALVLMTVILCACGRSEKDKYNEAAREYNEAAKKYNEAVGKEAYTYAEYK